MDKRLAKRHKRQVSRAKDRIKLSEPDLRTAEQIKAARDASRVASGTRTAGTTGNAALSFRGPKSSATRGAAKTDV